MRICAFLDRALYLFLVSGGVSSPYIRSLRGAGGGAIFFARYLLSLFFPSLPFGPREKSGCSISRRIEDKIGKGRAGQDKPGQDATRQGKTGKDWTRKDKARQGKTRPYRTGQDRNRQDRTRQDWAIQGKTRQDGPRQDKTEQDAT